MIITSFLNILSFSQVIFLCNKQSDCYIGSYCDSTSKCQDCSELKHCNALNTNCCSKDFLVQCVNNPYKCKEDNGSSNSTYETGFNSYLFLVSFTIITISYLSIGSYNNKYIHRKTGIEILPNIIFWRNFYGLVKDGWFFTFSKCKECYHSRFYNTLST